MHPRVKNTLFFLCVCFWSLSIAPCSALDETSRFYVSTDGSDEWSGLLDRPNNERTDGPFRTLRKAQSSGRSLLSRGNSSYTITVRKGTYWLDRTVEIQQEDSGSPGRPTVFEAYPGEHPLISGGVRLTDWRPGPGGVWASKLPPSLVNDGKFTSLYVNGQRRYRPRWPASGYAQVSDAAPRIRGAVGEQDQFIFSGQDIKSAWAHEPVEVVVFHFWTTTRAFVASVDDALHLLTLKGRAWSTKPYGKMSKGRPYIVDNVRELLKPGQWYLDQHAGEVLYWPLPGEDIHHLEIIAPRLEVLLKIGGPTGEPVHDVHISGLTFAHTNWQLTSSGLSSGQSEMALQSALQVQNATNIRLSNFAILHTGGYGLAFGRNTSASSVTNCELRDLGGGGIRIGTSSRTDVASAIPNDPESTVARIVVSDCRISGGGRLHPAAVGIWIGDAQDCDIVHNEVSNFYYTGISVGWTWGYKPSRAVRNRVSYNKIYDIGKGRMSDLAGIYTLGVSPGTVVNSNYISSVRAREYGAWGLYADEGTSGVHFINNIVSDVGNTGFMIHFGKSNFISNNIFAAGREGAIRCNVPELSLSAFFQSNILVYSSGTYPLVDKCDRQSFKFDSNVIWPLEGISSSHPDDWRYGTRSDMHSRTIDPLFVKATDGDYFLKPDSPLIVEGFGGVDALNAGSRQSFRAVDEPPVLEAFD